MVTDITRREIAGNHLFGVIARLNEEGQETLVDLQTRLVRAAHELKLPLEPLHALGAIILSPTEVRQTVQTTQDRGLTTSATMLRAHVSRRLRTEQLFAAPSTQHNPVRLHAIRPSIPTQDVDGLWLVAEMRGDPPTPPTPPMGARSGLRRLLGGVFDAAGITKSSSEYVPTLEIGRPYLPLGRIAATEVDPRTLEWLSGELHVTEAMELGPPTIVDKLDRMMGPASHRN